MREPVGLQIKPRVNTVQPPGGGVFCLGIPPFQRNFREIQHRGIYPIKGLDNSPLEGIVLDFVARVNVKDIVYIYILF